MGIVTLNYSIFFFKTFKEEIKETKEKLQAKAQLRKTKFLIT